MFGRPLYKCQTQPRNLAWFVFGAVLFISGFIVYKSEKERVVLARLTASEAISERVIEIGHALDHSLSATYAIATLVRESNGLMGNFDSIATNMLEYYPGVSVFILAPDGIIRNAIPLAGNERALGLNLLEDPVMRSEATLARSSGQLTLSGPVELRQGGQGLIARLPIFLGNNEGEKFWGFSNVVLRLPQALNAANLSALSSHELDYRLWKINAETGDVQIIAQSSEEPLDQPVENTFAVPNGQWTLSVAPHNGWLNPQELAYKCLLALVISALFAYLARLQTAQFQQKAKLEREVARRTTEILSAQQQLEATLDAIPDLLFEIDANGTYLSCHAPRNALLTEPIETLIGKNIKEVLPVDAEKAIKVGMEEALIHGYSHGHQIVLQFFGKPHWFAQSISRKAVSSGEVDRFIVISHDITDRKNAELALLRSENFSRTIVNTSPVCIKLIDADGTLLSMNPAGLELIQARSETEALNRSVFDFISEEHRIFYREFHQAVCRGNAGTMEYEIVGLNGQRRWLYTNATPFSFDSNAPFIHLAVTFDITESKNARDALELAASVFTHAREGIMITDEGGVIVDVNNTFTEITGYQKSEVIGKTPHILKSGLQPSEFYASLWNELRTNGFWSGELWNRKKSGELYAEMLTISAIRDHGTKSLRYVALFSDVTVPKQHQRQLEHLAHYDALTGLPNRVLLADRLSQAMSRCQRQGDLIAVVYLDLDGFKFVNDQYGHSAGDHLLAVLSQSMRQSLRDSDTLARIGGDEFVAVLADLQNANDVDPLMKRLLEAASAVTYFDDGQRALQLQVSASAGLTLFPEDDVDAEVLLRHADQAMYVAKQAGKNSYHIFDVAHDFAQKSHNENLERIRKGLKKEEFLLYYQPKIDLQNGRIVGAEALIRWSHPERGLLTPASFIGGLADPQVSVEIDTWVIQSALTQMCAWKSKNLDIEISVNTGVHQLQRDDFEYQLRAILSQYNGVPSKNLQLEVLEINALEDFDRTSASMHACKAFGISFALDDFGTGYSSLTYLKHLPVSLLKIDQSFVRNMLNDPNDLAIVNSVIGLAHAFNHEVIAEGVETRAHGEALLALGCHLVQGYGIARPMAADAFETWIRNWDSESIRWLA